MSSLWPLSLMFAAGGGPTWDEFRSIVLLQNHTVRVVLLGTTLLGITAGVVGTFMLLRKRALVGDVVGHSALPGIAIAFLTMEILVPGSGKSLPALLIGAFISGLAGAVCVMLVGRFSRIKADAAMAMVLSVFYGAGAALFTVVQRIPSGTAAGLQGYLNGKTASLVADDVWLFAATGAASLTLTVLLHKEFTLLCFDEDYAAADGWPVVLLDTILIGLVVTVTIIGMQSVGLILVVATLIIPPAAARFWTDDIRWMSVVAGVVGGASSYIGTVISSVFPRMAAGAVIVLTGSALFALSLLIGRKRGVLNEWFRRNRTRRDVGRVDLLRAIFERVEEMLAGEPPMDEFRFQSVSVSLSDLLPMRRWEPSAVRRLLRGAETEGLLTRLDADHWRLTARGADEAQRIARNHRLWEMYLMQYADIAPSHVDRDADLIEHVLDAEIVRELERRLAASEAVPPSSHVVGAGAGNASKVDHAE